MFQVLIGFFVGLCVSALVIKHFVERGQGQMKACSQCDYKLQCEKNTEREDEVNEFVEVDEN